MNPHPAKLGILTILLTFLAPAGASVATTPDHDAVTAWVTQHSHPIDSTRPGAPDRDLAALGESVGDASIVGLGEAAHELAELTDLKHRAVRYLVKRMGFRSIAWEEDWSLGTQVNDYVLGRRDDLRALLGQMSNGAWRTREVARVLTWIRGYNETHADKVRFFGVEYYATRPFAYDRIESYVARHAPGRLTEAREHLTAIRPFTDNMGEYLGWYLEQPDKAPYVAHANALHDLVASLPHRRGDRKHAVTEHAARQVRSFYKAFTLSDNFSFRDARAAESLRWWQHFRGDRTIYWAASAHTAGAKDLTISPAPFPDAILTSAGHYLREWYGHRYVSIGFTFDHGPGRPRPADNWFERPLGGVDERQFLVDLRGPAPRVVRKWLHRPMVTRGLPGAGPDATMSSPSSPSDWFDVVVHRQRITTATPLP